MNFETLGVSSPILKALEEERYVSPTPIQEKAIPAALQGRDILGLAQTGTGKTAAFSVPILQVLSLKKQGGPRRKIRALILTPTRELAIQIQESITTYGRHTGLKSMVVFGGVNQTGQVKQVRAGVDILIATPGRLVDLVQQKFIRLDGIEIFVLDEADRMLDMGFIHEVRRILEMIPEKKQTLLFSATMPREMIDIVKNLLKDAVKIEISPASSTVDAVEQSVYLVDRNHKIDVFTELFIEKNMSSVLVFTRTKHGADKVVRELARRQIEAQAIHGNKSQNARQKALEKFKSGKIKVLVATDIASRGIDIDELEYVINYDLPETPETYVHRIGRTGRAGNSGVAISLCSYQEQSLLADIERVIRKEIKIKSNSKYPMVDLTEKQTKKNPQRKNDVSKDKKTKSEKTGDKKETKNSRNKKNKTSDKWKKRQYNASKQSAL